MSIVGPRPKLLREEDRYGRALPTVLRVKPGVTGLWQVSGRDRLTIQERVSLDLRYVSTRTLRGCLLTLVQLWHPSKHGAC